MPKSKEYLSESESDSDEPQPKKTKKGKEKAAESKAKKSNTMETSFQLSQKRWVSVSEFRGKPLVNIREYYEADGEMKPGRKGISLSVDQWKNLKSHMEGIDQALKDF